jgi:seryl-tRNA synthetase
MPEAPATEADADIRLAAAGLRWHPGLGQVTLSGPLLRLAADCDRAFTILAGVFGAQEEQHPAAVSAELLNRLDYFSSFPHQATFAAALDGDEDNLAAFAADPFGEAGVRLTRLAPVRAVLTPAACYHIYAAREGEELAAPQYVTTVATCFRREAALEPLVRQWAFRMREVVCAGTAAEVREFLARARELADRLCRELSLPVVWEPATDSFFRPLTNPKFLLQKVAPTKEEAVFGGRVAIASVNLHHDHIGSAFRISRAGEAAHTGCLAFGVERWLYALSSRYGEDPAGWPSVAAAASRAVAPGNTA